MASVYGNETGTCGLFECLDILLMAAKKATIKLVRIPGNTADNHHHHHQWLYSPCKDLVRLRPEVS
jgi:hypothetical protein